MKARSAKAKGARLEKKIVDLFRRHGFKSRKQPGSGIYQSFPHDVYVETPRGRPLILEAKKWKNGWRTGDKARGQADVLVIERDYGEPMAYLPLVLLVDLIAEAEDDQTA